MTTSRQSAQGWFSLSAAFGFILLLPCCSSTPMLTRWEFTGGPHSQHISTIVVDERNPSHLLAGLTTGEVYASSNGGLDWEKLSTLHGNAAIRLLVQDPEEAMRFFAATDSGLFLTTNGGAGWLPIVMDGSQPERSCRSLAIDPYNSKVMYAGTAGRGIYKTTDGGDHWKQTNFGLDSIALAQSRVSDVRIDPSRPDDIYAAIKGIGVVMSTGGGGSWTALSSIVGSTGIAPTSIVLHPKKQGTLCFGIEGGGIYKSTNGGGTWSPSRYGGGGPSPINIITHPALPDFLYAGTEDGVVLSTDFGSSWRSIAGALPHVATSIALVPGQPAPTLFAYGEGVGLSQTSNNGVSWVPILSSLGNATATILDGDEHGSVLFAADGRSVHRWSASTREWISASSGLTGGQIVSLAVTNDSASNLVAATTAGIFASRDGGSTWSSHVNQLSGRQTTLVSSHPIFDTRVLANADDQVFFSTDKGTSWNPTKPVTDKYRVRSFTFSPIDAGLVFGAVSNKGVIISRDGGVSWERSSYGMTGADISAVSLDDADKQVVYAWTATGEGFRSTNSGLVWDRYSPPWRVGEEVHLAIDRHRPSDMVALVGRERAFYSRSGGRTWFTIQADPHPGDVVSVYWISSSQSLYGGIQAMGVYRIVLKEILQKLFEPD